MNLRTYLDDLPRGGIARFADVLAVSSSFLSQMAAGTAPISPERCVDIERATNGVVTRRDLRPGDWHRIWPELVDAEHPAPASEVGAGETAKAA